VGHAGERGPKTCDESENLGAEKLRRAGWLGPGANLYRPIPGQPGNLRRDLAPVKNIRSRSSSPRLSVDLVLLDASSSRHPRQARADPAREVWVLIG
jgi:hypothetical protein